jgi:hypothetical protein
MLRGDGRFERFMACCKYTSGLCVYETTSAVDVGARNPAPLPPVVAGNGLGPTIQPRKDKSDRSVVVE